MTLITLCSFLFILLCNSLTSSNSHFKCIFNPFFHIFHKYRIILIWSSFRLLVRSLHFNLNLISILINLMYQLFFYFFYSVFISLNCIIHFSNINFIFILIAVHFLLIIRFGVIFGRNFYGCYLSLFVLLQFWIFLYIILLGLFFVILDDG